MKTIKRCAISALLLAATAAAQQPAAAQQSAPSRSPAASANSLPGVRRAAPPRPTGPTPHLADGTVDLWGVWNGGGPTGNIAQGLPKGEKLPLLPSAEKILKSRQSKDDPESNCLPAGVPRQAPYPWRIVQTPTHVFFLYEGNIHSYRQIFVDGRKHPADPDPTWYGHSIGHYEGDSLVVDTIGFNDKFWFDFAGNPHTEQLHTIERFTRKDYGTLAVQIEIIDPGAYSRPFTVNFIASLRPKEELMEYMCAEGQQDTPHLVGFVGIE